MIKIEIKGLSKVIKKFTVLPREMKIALRDAVRKSAFLVEAEAKPITPVAQPWKWKRPVKGYLGGTLRKSIRSEISPYRAVIAPHTEYAIYVHEGTRYWPLSKPPYMPGTVRQFMKIGAEKATPKIQRAFEQGIEKALKK